MKKFFIFRELIMTDSNINELADGTRAQNLSLAIELSAEKIQDFQAAFSIMDTQSKGFVGADDINQVAQAAGISKTGNNIKKYSLLLKICRYPRMKLNCYLAQRMKIIQVELI
jgi:hypothetical protein